jgi:hypothetical protein
MKRWRLLGVLVGLGLSIGSARANDPPLGVPGQIFYPHTQIAPPPVTGPTMTGPAYYTPPNYPALPPIVDGPRPIRVLMQKFGVGCWSHMNNITCGSLRADLTFAFSACRPWIGEPCQHGPQAVPPGEPMPPPSLAPWGILNPVPYSMSTPVAVRTAPTTGGPPIVVPPAVVP